VASRIDLELLQGNDETLNLTVTNEESDAPVDLTGKTLNLLIKKSQVTPDSDPSTVTLSSGGVSPAISIPVPASGQAIAQIASTLLLISGSYWWKLNVVEDVKTAGYGIWKVVPL
jgi:hypothetical protein